VTPARPWLLPLAALYAAVAGMAAALGHGDLVVASAAPALVALAAWCAHD